MKRALWLLVALLPAAVAAEPYVLEIDAARSLVRFELGATLHTVRGTAAIREGARLRFDPESGEASGRAEVDATSADTGIDARDERLHQEVLESDAHPTIAFDAHRIEVRRVEAGVHDFVLRGDLTLVGGVHEVSLAGRGRGTAPGDFTLGAETVLPYVAWGLTDVSNFLLSIEPEVTVRLEVAGAITPAAGPPPD